MRVEWSAIAVADLKNISEWIEHDRNMETANRVTRSVYEAVQTLPRMPHRGRYGRLEGTRELVIPKLPYVVVYRVLDDRVQIIAVVHGAQRWP